ncbi:MAG: fused MFS/spermidine synthase [Alphaproteobacteria bacterium GM202ARS2]|nr:fused MFS/spermidine synthase [Alphaproteobacteria bacterium GM202ARS2]
MNDLLARFKHMLVSPAILSPAYWRGLFTTREGVVQLFATATLFLSAFLLFAVQPMIGRMTLPLLGGAPAVWITAVLFFQIALAVAYIYVDVLTRYLSFIPQIAVHAILMVLAVFFLPISLSGIDTSDASYAPVWFLASLYVITIGLPFLMNAASAPLLQKWFSTTAHPHAHDPYFLYAASNAGSLLALILYVLLIEPELGLQQQSQWWMNGFIVLTLMVVAFAVLTRQSASVGGASQQAKDTPQKDKSDTPLTWENRLWWCLYAFIPSSLLLGSTLHVTTDITAIPLLWVVPLILYLLTFIICFAKKPILSETVIHHLHAGVITVYALLAFVGQTRANVLFSFLLVMAVLLTSALLCHQKLVAARPHTRHLGQFYVWLAVGGALGGVFNVLIAPLLFDSVVEYPLMIIAACLLRPQRLFIWHNKSAPNQDELLWRAKIFDYIVPTAFLLLAFWLISSETLLKGLVSTFADTVWLSILAVAVFSFVILLSAHRPIRFTLIVATFITSPLIFDAYNRTVLYEERNFFGVYRVIETQRSKTTAVHTLKHGTTVHGSQWRDLIRRTQPTTYYHKNSPVGEVFRSLRFRNKPLNVAAIGLGAGTVACYRQGADTFTFFELDPYVAEIARDLNAFTYLDDCAPNARIVIGDARINISKEKNKQYDFLFVDAFSSDAIPVHLMTTEAIDEYFKKMKDDGIIMFHTSNRFVELALPLATYAWQRRYVYKKKKYSPSIEDRKQYQALGGSYIIIAKTILALDDRLIDAPGWERIQAPPYVRPWTDDYANVLGALLVRYFLQRGMIDETAWVLEQMID